MDVDNIDDTLMPLETPILKVSRPVAACSRCRNAKIKCDGKLPACSSCEKNGRAAECTNTNDQFARGKERSYVSTLETRIDKLKEKLEEARARKPSVVSMDGDDDNANAPSQRPSHHVHEPPTPNTSKSLRRREGATIDDLVSDFGYLSVNATARDFLGFTNAMSYARLILWACSKERLPEGLMQPLPARHQAIALIQHYLNHIFLLIPVFDEASFWGSLDNVYSRHPQSAQSHDHFFVRLVLAISSASMSLQRGDRHYLEAIGHVCAALGYSESVLHPGEIAGIQALVLLTEFAMLDPHHFDSWGLIGAASRAMVDLGLHQDPPKGTSMSKAKLELRRRVYHCVYVLDRSTSLVQTRAFSFSDDSANVKIPFNKPSSSQPTSPAPSTLQGLWLQTYEHAQELIKLRQLQSQWYGDLFHSGRDRWHEPYPYIWDTCSKLQKWFQDLPPSISPNMHAFFELDMLYSYVYVLSPSPRVPAIDPFAQKLIFEYCIQYADLMLRLISDPGYKAPLTFYDAMRVYMTGRQFLDLLQQNPDSLLSGQPPPHPEVKPSTAPPPPVPPVSVPPGETLVRFNTVRSINCMKQISECLSRFGVRWGYMSWNQRYQAEIAATMEDLDSRLQILDGTTRRQSVWTTGSVASISYGSSPPAMLPAQEMASQHPNQVPQASLQAQAYSAPRFSPPAQQYQPLTFSQQPAFDFNLPPTHSAVRPFDTQAGNVSNTFHPKSQFASWAGYGGPGGHADASDEENAVPPDAES